MATITPTARIGPADHGRRMTLEQFGDMDVEEGYRYELASGLLEVTEVPNDPHGEIVWIVLRLLADYDSAHPRVTQRAGGAAEFRLWLPGMISGRNPDVAFSLRNTPKDRRGRRLPTLAFEVVSEGRDAIERDYVAKRAEYLAYGLREFWIVDPATKTVTVLVRDGDVWVEHVFRGDQQANGLALPGFNVCVSDLWPASEADSGDGQTADEVS
jgi:Uma2 family endonuclease